MGYWLVFSSNIPTIGTMVEQQFIDNTACIRRDVGVHYDILIDAKNLIMWRWRADNLWVIYMREGATEIGEIHAVR